MQTRNPHRLHVAFTSGRDPPCVNVEQGGDEMSRRVWTGVLAGVLGALLVLGVAVGADQVGRDDTVVRTVGDGEVVRVVGHGGYGPGPGFFLFPLLVVGIIALLVWRRRGWGGGGHWGPGPWSHRGPEGAFSEWHERAHAERSTASGGRADETGPAPPAV
jgi:hypothetical protein